MSTMIEQPQSADRGANGKRGGTVPALLAREISRAVDRGQTLRALRLVENAMRFKTRPAALSEVIIRAHLVSGQTDAAVAMSRTSDRETESILLLRAIGLIRTGDHRAAHETLLALTHRNRSAVGERLLGRLFALLGDREEEDRAARRAVSNALSPESLTWRLAVAACHGRRDVARSTARRLVSWCSLPRFRARIRMLLASLGHQAAEASIEPSDEIVVQLAAELAVNECVLPILVEAQQRAFDRSSARLIVEAIRRSQSSFAHPVAANAARARLEVLLDGPAIAMRTLDAALETHPYSVELRRLHNEFGKRVRPQEATEPPQTAPIGRISPDRTGTRKRAA